MGNNVTFHRRKVLKKWVRFTLFVIIITFFALAIFLMSSSINSIEKSKKKEVLYSYNINQDLDYKVSLYDNSFIESDYLKKDELYISDLVKSIDINYKYNYSGSKIKPINYTYKITATINGEYQLDEEEEGNSKVWTKSYTLLEPQIKQVTDSTSIQINEPIKLNYKLYDSIVSKFRQELKLPITASLNVVFSINITGEESGQMINDTKEMVLTIPLNQQAFRMTETIEPLSTKNVEALKAVSEKSITVNKRKLLAGIILIGSSIFLFVLFFREIFNIQKKNAYTVKLNKLLKDYGDVIIEIVTPINDENLDIIEVKNFNEIMDLEEELRVPILFYETLEYEEGEFSIVHGNIAYKYVLKNE